MDPERCFGCGALVPAITGPTHAYMLSAPGCWAAYCELQPWMASLAADDAASTVQQAVDSYAVQHATNPERRNRQSVAIHLMSLCASIEYGIPGTELRVLLGQWTHRPYVLPESIPSTYSITVRDISDAVPDARSLAVDQWAAATWEAWTAHHRQVRAWLRDVGARFLN